MRKTATFWLGILGATLGILLSLLLVRTEEAHAATPKWNTWPQINSAVKASQARFKLAGLPYPWGVHVRLGGSHCAPGIQAYYLSGTDIVLCMYVAAQSELNATITHETGHMIGLGHSGSRFPSHGVYSLNDAPNWSTDSPYDDYYSVMGHGEFFSWVDRVKWGYLPPKGWTKTGNLYTSGTQTYLIHHMGNSYRMISGGMASNTITDARDQSATMGTDDIDPTGAHTGL